ncbi:FHA domain-containing protein [Agromyces sp. SYSU K20354]|uniref:FHA domain-containing protein n=1 Tax=Agromyces cavernae TaxID=2898659 RepID=UPI001E38A527|nr:FHA domain-containing protein [Agromyces cavernae]MCD2441628.1 FHA domain-containing protein [Agromyces cavernae]
MYCLECGQLIPQEPARPPVPAQFARPAAPAAAEAPAPSAPHPASRIEPVPLPGTLPWQQRPATASDTPSATRPEPQAAAVPVERIELAFSTGQRVIVGGSAVIGRKPADTALAMGVQAIEVADDTRSVSRVHLFLDLAEGVITVGDAGSSNGSGVERNGAVAQLESAGTRVEVVPGDTVWVGDISFAIRAA